MTLASLEYLAFLLVALPLYGLARPWHRRWLLLVASIAFIWAGGWLGLGLVSGTAVVDACLARRMAASGNPGRRGRLLALSLLWNLGILGVFKYAGFAIENAEAVARAFGYSASLPRLALPVPPGISYYTLSSIAYVLDVYWGRTVPPQRLSDYFLFLTCFPKFLAGPIARAGSVLAQFVVLARPGAADLEAGAARFLVGAVKKCVIADNLAPHVNLIFVGPGQYDGFTLLQGALGYAVQIYFDFAGYSDMAIGSARLLGIQLPENFSMPYASRSIAEFWRRWHITLSAWLRDYLFLPMAYAGSRAADRLGWTARRADLLTYCVCSVLTMLVCGLWHGASWNFVAWGALHGVALSVNRAWIVLRPKRRGLRPRGLEWCSNVLSRLATLGVVLVGWILFRTASIDESAQYLYGILAWQDGTRVPSQQILVAMPLVVLGHFALRDQWAESLPSRSLLLRVGVYAALLFLVTTVGGSEAAPFLYFQF